ncbi:hypothetical protein IMZ48_47570 [Candidatus Bathyarchaeota archaeon]|nr:hypothetical protein [Candidatus Bathyarchaeota archaeon]
MTRRGASALTKATALLLTLAWLSVSLGAFLFQSLGPDSTPDPERKARLTAAFLDWHFMVLNPCATASILLSFFAQSHATLWLRSRGSLSIESLAAQALVFAFLASSWKKRLNPTDDGSEDPHCRVIAWYNSGGWAVLDSALSSLIQGYLLVLSIFAMCMGPRRRDKSKKRKKNKLKKKQKQKDKDKGKKAAKADDRTPLLALFHRSPKKEKTPLLPLFHRPPKKEKRGFRYFLAKLKWRRKKKMRKHAKGWRRILRRQNS